MSRHGTELLLRQRRAARRFEGVPATTEDGTELTILTRILDDPDRPDWRFCVRCNVLAPEKVAGDECGFCGGALTPTGGPRVTPKKVRETP